MPKNKNHPAQVKGKYCTSQVTEEAIYIDIEN